MNERLLSASICLLLLTSMAPTVAAMGPSDSVIWGISYDWGNYENDIEELTGIDTNAVNEDLEEAADYAGFLLESDQVVSGMTQFFIESWDEDETVEITDANGDTHEVTKRVTELTIRHGNLGDMGFTAAWTDENESIDIWMSASTEQLFVIDAVYTEYVDDELMVYGGDLDMSGEFALESNMEFNLQVIAADEVLAPELGMGFSVSFEIPSIESEWRANEPLDYLQDLVTEPTDSDENDDGWFTCNDGETIPSDWVNDGEEDCYDGSDETQVWDCKLQVNPSILSELDEDSYNEAVSSALGSPPEWPDWCGEEVPSPLALDGSEPNLPPDDTLSAWYEEYEDQIMARTADHIWYSKIYDTREYYQSESDCMDDGGDLWDSSVKMCGYQLDGEADADSTLIHWENDWGDSGWNRYEMPTEDYLFIGTPEMSRDDGSEYESGLIEGEFSTVTGYSLMLSIDGIPAEDFDISLDAFNVQLSDSIPGQGIFSEDMTVFSAAMWDWDCPPVGGVENVNTDPSSNETVSAQCGLAPPISMGMASMMGISMMSAFDSGVQELFSAIEEQVGAWLEEISPEEDTFVCDNGEEIPAEWENDGEIDCQDGSDENESGGDGTYTCDNGQVIPASWVNDGEEDCQDGSDEDGSEDIFQKYIDMFEALNNSNLQKTMEAFGEKLEELMEDNDPSEPLANLDDLCPIMFWDTSNSRVLGMALMATDGGEDYEVLLGPEILGVKQHSYELSVQYLTGQDARDAKLDVLGIIDLRDLAPDSKHDVEELYDILGEDFLPDLDQTDTDGDGVIDYFDQDDDGDGMFDWEDPDPLSPPEPVAGESTGNSVPGLGIIATISLLGAAMIVPRREE